MVSDRKFKLICSIAICSYLALWFDKLSGGEFVTITTLVFTTYVAGNVTQKKVTKDADKHS